MPASSPCAPRGGLQADGVHPAHLGEHALELDHQLERALRRRGGRQRMERREAGEASHLLVQHRIVLHGARAERIEVRRRAEVPL